MIEAGKYVAAGKELLDYTLKQDIPYTNNGSSLKGMDCQGLMEYLLRQCGVNQNWRGSNDMWRNALSWSGTVEECVEKFGAIPSGAWLFIWKQDGAPSQYTDGLGNASHVGCYLYDRVVVHASSSRGKVTQSYIGRKSINGGWNRVGLCKLIDYGVTTDSGSQPSGGNQQISQGGNTMAYIVSPDGGFVNIRSAARTTAPYVVKAQPGEQAEILEAGDEWTKVVCNGKTGYMMTKFLSENPTTNSNSDADSGSNALAKEKIQAAINALNEALKVL